MAHLISSQRIHISKEMRLISSLILVVFSVGVASGAAAADTGRPASSVELEAALSAAQAAPTDAQQEESLQRVYEAFRRLSGNLQHNSLGNFRRLVQRLNQLVGPSGNQPAQPVAPVTIATTTTGSPPGSTSQKQITVDANEEHANQVIKKLEQAAAANDQHTIRALGDDVNRLIETMNDSYLRNIRRVVERVNRLIGRPSGDSVAPANSLHQSGDRLQDPDKRQPGFPGWDELIVAVDRMQKSLASFVRTSTQLVTSG